MTLQTEARPVPGLWKLRLLGFAVTFAFFFNSWVLPNIFAFPLIPLLISFLIAILSWWTITHWAKHTRVGYTTAPGPCNRCAEFFCTLSTPIRICLLILPKKYDWYDYRKSGFPRGIDLACSSSCKARKAHNEDRGKIASYIALVSVKLS